MRNDVVIHNHWTLIFCKIFSKCTREQILCYFLEFNGSKLNLVRNPLRFPAENFSDKF